MKTKIVLVAAATAVALTAAPASAQHWLKNYTLHDLSHPIPMFREVKGKGMLAWDPKKPFKGSKPVKVVLVATWAF